MMTPDDIPDLLLDLAGDEITANLGYGITATPHEAAASIINAAIKIGLVFSRIPETEDPRVLRRALETACIGNIDEGFAEFCIELARRELESEGQK